MTLNEIEKEWELHSDKDIDGVWVERVRNLIAVAKAARKLVFDMDFSGDVAHGRNMVVARIIELERKNEK